MAILEGLRLTCGVPERLPIDNGPEFVSTALDAWACRHGLQREFSRPEKPNDKFFAESFNGRFRDECLDQHWFASLEGAIEAWRVDDNTERPHRALNQQTPAAWAASAAEPPG